MRTVTPAQVAELAKAERQLDYDLRITTRAGREVSLRSYQGRELLKRISLNENVDSPTIELEFELQREFEDLHFSPLMSQNSVNLSGGGYDPLLGLDNIVQVIVGFPDLAVPSDSLVIFFGRIVSVDAGGPFIRVVARDQVFDLTQAYIDPALGAVGGVDRGSSIEMAGPCENIMSYLIESFAPSVPFIYTPVSPNWVIEPYLQERMSVWEALDRFAMQIGWDLRWRWGAGNTTMGFLTFFEPGRGDPTIARTFGPDEYFSLSQLAVDLAGVRNSVFVTFGPGNARYTVVAEDSVSISKYRFARRMWIEESSNSPLQSATEATKMAQGALSDLSSPKAVASAELPFFPWAELHDRYAFSSNGVHLDSTVSFSVSGVTHQLAEGKASTTLLLRDGAPISGSKRWLRREFREGVKYL